MALRRRAALKGRPFKEIPSFKTTLHTTPHCTPHPPTPPTSHHSGHGVATQSASFGGVGGPWRPARCRAPGPTVGRGRAGGGDLVEVDVQQPGEPHRRGQVGEHVRCHAVHRVVRLAALRHLLVIPGASPQKQVNGHTGAHVRGRICKSAGISCMQPPKIMLPQEY